MEDDLPDDLESLVGLARMMGVGRHLAEQIREHGLSEDVDIQYMYRIAFKTAIKNEFARREYEKKWTTNQH